MVDIFPKFIRVLSCAALPAFLFGPLYGQTAPSPMLLTTASLTSTPDGQYQAAVTISNNGTAAATGVSLATATLAAVNGSPAPESLPDIPVGGQISTTILFGSDAGTPGANVVEHYTGTYTGGSFGGSLRAVLPAAAVAPTVTATVNTTQPGTPTPDHFMGFSMDSTITDDYVGSGPTADPILVNLINNFTPYNGIPLLRPAAIAATPTSSNISAKFLHALTTLEAATGAPLIVTMGLASTTYENNVASSVTSALGSGANVQFELGNEPDQEKPAITFSTYIGQYNAAVAAVAPYTSGKFAVGMASGSTTWDTANDAAFLTDASGTLGTLTSHEYPLSACEGTASITIAHLLSDNISNAFYRRFQPIVQAAAPYGVPVRAGEMNSVSCSGLSGVSDVFASSLWVLDSLFELQLSGASGMNLHTGSTTSGTPYLPYNAFDVSGTQVQVMPVYYGMLMFAEAIQNNAAPVPVTTSVTDSQNVKIWATVDSQNVARVVIIEKDLTAGVQTVAVDLGSSVNAAAIVSLLNTTSSSGLASTNQVYIQGQTFDGTTDGHLLGTPVTTSIQPVQGVYTINVPNGSAAMLTIQLPASGS